MNRPVRAALAALALLLTDSASAAAQQRECPAADRVRVGLTPPPGVSEATWRAGMLAEGLVTPETELVQIPWDSLHSMGDDVRQLHFELDDTIRARVGEVRTEVVVLARVEPDSTISRLLLVLPSGVVDLEQSVGETMRRVRAYPALRDGCPIVHWYPILIEFMPPVRIPRPEQ
jgi:hypothetical protein